MDAAVVVLGVFGAFVIFTVIVVYRLADDVRTWRQDATDNRICWLHERDLRLRVTKQLEEELRRQKDGPYR